MVFPPWLCRVAWNHFVTQVAFRDHPAQRLALTLTGRDVERAAAAQMTTPALLPHPALAAVERTVERDHFTAAEVDALVHLPGLSDRDRLMLRILAETGLRRRAVAWLTVDGVYDAALRTARATGRATEKGLVVRHFVLGDVAPQCGFFPSKKKTDRASPTKRLLEAYCGARHRHERTSVWLFPRRRNPTQPVAASTVNRVLVAACRRVGLHGRHVHCHGLRKFVVCRLMEEHNRLARWWGVG